MMSKKDAKMAQGMAILAMLALHLFCRQDMSMYNIHLNIAGTPLLYYLGLFGDLCVPVYCFSSGYAQFVLAEKDKEVYRKKRFYRVWKFLCHFWLIVFVFCVIGLIIGNNDIPQNIRVLMGNLLLYRMSYNGAWWFVLSYVFLILISPIMYTFVKRKSVLLVGMSGYIYFFSYLLYFVFPIKIANVWLAWGIEQVLLLGRVQFPFVIGMFFCRWEIIETLKSAGEKHVKLKRFLIIALPVLCFFIHCFIQSLIISPITGLITLICFHLWDKPEWIEAVCLFFGKHSLNIWLVHMFFYQTLFVGLVYTFREPVLVYGSLLLISVMVSYGVDGIEKLIRKGMGIVRGR